jgi:hypothetical protein
MKTLNKFNQIAWALALIMGSAQASLVAYNDFNTTTGNPANTTSFNTTSPTNTGSLKDFTSGVTFATVQMAVIGTSGTGGGTPALAGTEVGDQFNPFMNTVGYVTAFGASVNNLMIFSGLDPSKRYELAIASYPANQPTNTVGAQITNADSFVNATTAGGGSIVSTTAATNDTTSVLQNGARLIVYTNIDPGADGSFALNGLAPNGNTMRYNGFRFTQLDAVPEPSAIILTGFGLLILAMRLRGGRTLDRFNS